MFDWFWDLPPMRTAQGWVDTTRAIPIDPIWAMVVGMALVFLVMWALNRPQAVRDHKTQGQHYAGKLTPKTLKRMLILPQPNEAKTRKQMIEMVERARAKRRRAEREGKPEIVQHFDEAEEEGIWSDLDPNRRT